MKKIIELSENLSNLIAAGEVVERPMNVVKELVENSIDANAKNIKIDLTDCGIVNISVLDDGEGINKEQMPNALKRHATSKIQTEDDLFRISSLGFRGEALPSIASVSDFRITSNDGETNYYLAYKAGKKISEGNANLPKGTQIEVRNLFFNTPARYKHLGSSYQELSAITDYIYKVAISNPNISFTLINNQKVLFKSSGNGELLEVISEAYGANIGKKMIAFNASNNLYKISGYTTNNEIFRSNRNALIVLVNSRIIKNLNILYAITDAYQTILPVGKHPLTVLNIQCDYDLIDVNVHPAKLEIRFTDEEELRKLITKTIKNCLHESELLKFAKTETLPREDETYNYSQNEISNAQNRLFEQSLFEIKNYSENFDDIQSFDKSSHNEAENENDDFDWLNDFDESTPIENSKSEELFEDEEYVQPKLIEEDSRKFFQNLDYIGQYHETYLMLQDDMNLYLIDQHAAMERVMYEKISNSFKEVTKSTYELLIPITIDYTKNEIDTLLNLQNDINKLGIEFEEFGNNSIVVRTIPTWIPQNLEVEFLSDIFNHYMSSMFVNKAKMYDSLAKSLSCKKSIKANMKITLEEVKTLLLNLDNCIMPYTCPHGRPTLIKFTKYEIEKLFKRVNN